MNEPPIHRFPPGAATDEPVSEEEVAARVEDFLRGRAPATREDWRALGPLGLRHLQSLAINPAVDDSGQRLRAAALATLGQLGGPSHVDALVEVLSEPGVPVVVRCGAIEGLGYIGGARALPLLQAQALDHDFKIRLYTVSALGRIGSMGARRILDDLGNRDPHSQVKRASVVELDRIAQREAREKAQRTGGER